MKPFIYFQRLKKLIVILATTLISGNLFATHAQSADITYQCLGGNQYEIQVSFYRDCAGVAAPNSVSVDIASVSCNQNFSVTLTRVPGTGVDVTQVCNSITTQCNGGNYPGVQEYIYRTVVTLPVQCVDWVFSFSLCCRNNAINTINNPGGENIYVEANLNNLNFTCNNSPSFSNPPVSYPCIGQTSCFNHGATDADGDSLYYSLLAPATGPNTTVTYLPGYSANQPLNSNPLVTINPYTGDICMSPTMLEVTVLAVQVEEWRNGVFVGSVMRDIQLRTVLCNNNLPIVTGINGSGQFSAIACAGSTLQFTIPSQDADVGQLVTLSWNNAISGATFTSNNQPNPTATFTWTPTTADVSNTPYCFTVQVSDNNCPLNGVQVYSFCITVSGLNITTGSSNANCGASNGSAWVTVSNGTSPFLYNWQPSGGNQANANGLSAGTYSVTVTDAMGCSTSQSVVVGNGSVPANINLTSTNVSCFGGNNGTINANANGGQQPYAYLWNNGATSSSLQNVPAGLYYVTITTASGCISSDSITITQPSFPITSSINSVSVSCFGGSNGSASITPSGGTTPYQYVWNTVPTQNTNTANGLQAGTYSATVTDNNGCTTTQTVDVIEPEELSISLSNHQNVSCFNGNNGSISVNVSGGISPYQYSWNNGTIAGNNAINNLFAGAYTLVVTDLNGCSTSINQTITQPSVLTSQITNHQNTTCYGISDGMLTLTALGGTPPYSYNWSNGATGVNAQNLNIGNYTAWVSDANGCSSVSTATITQPAIIQTTVSPDTLICPGTPISLNVQSIGGTGVLSYYWSNGTVGQNNTVSPSAETSYQVYSADANGCSGDTLSVFVSINDIHQATISALGDDNICEGEMAEIFATFDPGKGIYTYSWDNNLGNNLIPTAIFPVSTTTYTITATDNCGNSISDAITVQVNPLPEVQIPSQAGISCGTVSFNFQNQLPNPIGSTYNWNFGDNTFSTEPTPTKSYNQSGLYTVTLIVSSPFGCTELSTAIVNAVVNPTSKADFEFTPDEELTTNNAKLYFINNSTEASSYQWSFGDGISSTLEAPVHTYQKKGDYEITLVTNNIHNCSDSAKRNITIKPEFNFYIPNAFTPDDNGLNEVFKAVGEEINEFSMQIFDRWGEQIFETHDINKGWNGTAKDGSKIAQQDVYVYDIRLKDYRGKLHTMQGKVTLIK